MPHGGSLPTVGDMSAKGLLVIVASFTLGFASDAYASKAVHVSCGETITKDTRLANDLTDCPNNGLVIGADDITLDLNGHTIDGDGLDNLVEDCPDFHCDTGIDNTAHHHGTTIHDGAVQEFSSGIWIEGGADHRVRRLSVSRNGDGIDVALATDTVVTQSSVDGNVFGIWIGGSDNVRIERNAVLDYQGCGVEVQDSDHVLIERNSVFSNDPGAPIAGDACGIGLFNGSHLNRIERNSVSGNGFVGVLVAESDDNEVAGNHIFRNRDAVIVQAMPTRSAETGWSTPSAPTTAAALESCWRPGKTI
jgi:parallel beta-helix repeat protein